jgi:hypothetical protein
LCNYLGKLQALWRAFLPIIFVFSYSFCWKHSRWAQKCVQVLTCPLLLSDFNENWDVSDCRKTRQCERLHENVSSDSGMFTGEQTDVWTNTANMRILVTLLLGHAGEIEPPLISEEVREGFRGTHADTQTHRHTSLPASICEIETLCQWSEVSVLRHRGNTNPITRNSYLNKVHNFD